MKSLQKNCYVYMTVIVAALLASAFTRTPEGPFIVRQPDDQLIRAGADFSLGFTAKHGETYQWLRNGIPVQGETKPTLDFRHIDIKDAGNYACIVSALNKSVTTRAAALMVYTRKHNANSSSSAESTPPTPMNAGDPITVWASPLSSGGTLGSCPGTYAGYAYYSHGWTPVSGLSLYSAADENGRTDTSIRYKGSLLDSGCGQTGVYIPAPTASTLYRFYVFFPNNVPTTNYPITLTGFNP